MLTIELLILCILVGFGIVCCTKASKFEDPHLIKRKKIAGHYIPELHGAHLGRYVHDDSGRYYHIHIPYDGGYGDRGLKYIHDFRGHITRQPYSSSADDFSFGPDDHIRFSVEFNFNGTGWQIVDFEWIRDGDENIRYNLLSTNRLWGSDANIQVDDDDIIEEEPPENYNDGYQLPETNEGDSSIETPFEGSLADTANVDDQGNNKPVSKGYVYEQSERVGINNPQYVSIREEHFGLHFNQLK